MLTEVERPFDNPNLDKSYKGIDRVPTHAGIGPSPPGKFLYRPGEEAVDQYIFDDRFNNNAALIPDLARASEMLRMLAGSSRQFEIIFVRTVECGTPIVEEPGYSLLGYDVAGIAPAESTLFDWDQTHGREDFSLNANGLFVSFEEARRYRDSPGEYIRHEYGDQHIWEIYAVGESAE